MQYILCSIPIFNITHHVLQVELIKAAGDGDLQKVQDLLTSGADPNFIEVWIKCLVRDGLLVTPI